MIFRRKQRSEIGGVRLKEEGDGGATVNYSFSRINWLCWIFNGIPILPIFIFLFFIFICEYGYTYKHLEFYR